MKSGNEIRSQLRVSAIIFYSLILGLIFMFLVALYIVGDNGRSSGAEQDNIFIFIVPVYGFSMMFLSRLFYRKMISGYNAEKSLNQKITDFRNFKIISWAMVESACILSIIALMYTADYLYAVVFIFLLGYFFMIKPARESLISDMSLNSEESDKILKSYQ